MYKAWICYPRNDWDPDPEPPVVVFVEPETYRYDKVIPIAFYPLKEFDPDATPK